jgi:hypothetical protein
MYASASDAKDVVMRLDVAVVARAVMQMRNFARFPHLAQCFERAMHGCKRHVRMLAADASVDVIGARVVLRSEQRLNYRAPLGRDGQAALTASLCERFETAGRILAASPFAYNV